MKISKTFGFDAAHFLPNVPINHKCKHMHGHTYKVQIICEGEVDSRGMICDYAEIQEVWNPVYEIIDHKVLNDIEGLKNPTTEILAPWILNKMRDSLPQITAVRVYESESTYCEISI